MRYFSMFSGIGGFEKGIEQAYGVCTIRPDELADSEGPEKQHGTADEQQQWECVGYSEIDKYATKIYEKHFPTHTNFGDATRIDAAKLPDFDLLVGGFPCQAFSIAGKRRGFEDTRGTLFFDIAKILREKRPRHFILENVKGLLSHDSGNTFKTIISTLAELGYGVEWQVLNSKNFGVPQNRERVYIVGHLGGFGGRQVFPIREANPKDLRQIVGGSRGDRVYGTDGLSVTLASQAGGKGAKTGLYAVPLKFLDRNQKNYQGEYSFTVDTVNSGGVLKDYKIRRLTPKEAERLQGFPDDWTAGVSDTQRYKCCGNAVTVNVVEEVIKRLFSA